MSLKQIEGARGVKLEENLRQALYKLNSQQEVGIDQYHDEGEESQSIASLAASSCLETLRCGKIRDRFIIADKNHTGLRGSVSKIIQMGKGRNLMDEDSVNTYLVGDNNFFSPKIQESERLIMQESIESFKPLVFTA